ncbi:hypothetical protein U1Q18_031530 [Sarracenia purpurea var. burkii]
MYRGQGKGHNPGHGQGRVSDKVSGIEDSSAPKEFVGGVNLSQERQDPLRVLADATRVMVHGLHAFSKMVEAVITVERGLQVARTSRGRRPPTNSSTTSLTRRQSRKRKFKGNQSSSSRVPQQLSLTLAPPTAPIRRSGPMKKSLLCLQETKTQG